MKKTLFVILLMILFSVTSKSQSLPGFKLPDVDGNDVSFADITGNSVTIVSFWATWCSPCKEEMKKLNELYNKYKDRGLQYIAINQDDQKSVSKVKAFVNAQNYGFTVLLDTDKKIFESFNGKDEIPYTIILNKNKDIVSSHTGFKTGDEVNIEDLHSFL